MENGDTGGGGGGLTELQDLQMQANAATDEVGSTLGLLNDFPN